MNSFPPPPPPPPTPVTTFEVKSYEVDASSEVFETIKKWHRLLEPEAACVTMWTDNVPTILQQGPQCGLVALVMGAQALGHSRLDCQSVFKRAVEMGLTKQGEMFSASALCQLANDFHVKASLLEDVLSNNIQIVLDLLNQGKLLLVPYDADANHSPCLKKGHKAHWALIIGFILRLSSVSSDSAENLHRVKNINPYLNSLVTKDQVYLLAKHGKSKRLAIWDYASLEASNANLLQVDPKRNNPLEYVLPEGKDQLGAHLSSKMIVLGL